MSGQGSHKALCTSRADNPLICICLLGTYSSVPYLLTAVNPSPYYIFYHTPAVPSDPDPKNLGVLFVPSHHHESAELVLRPCPARQSV